MHAEKASPARKLSLFPLQKGLAEASRCRTPSSSLSSFFRNPAELQGSVFRLDFNLDRSRRTHMTTTLTSMHSVKEHLRSWREVCTSPRPARRPRGTRYVFLSTTRKASGSTRAFTTFLTIPGRWCIHDRPSLRLVLAQEASLRLQPANREREIIPDKEARLLAV